MSNKSPVAVDADEQTHTLHVYINSNSEPFMENL